MYRIRSGFPWYLHMVIGLVDVICGLITVLSFGTLASSWDMDIRFYLMDKRLQKGE